MNKLEKENRNAKIKRMTMKGKTAAEIAEKLNMKRSTISMIQNKNGFTKEYKKLTEKRILRMTKAGKTTTEIGKKLEMSQQNVSHIQSKLGINYGAVKKDYVMTHIPIVSTTKESDRKDIAERMLAQNMTQTLISNATGISISGVNYHARKKMGINKENIANHLKKTSKAAQ